jgi:hypothetical protein
MRAGSWPQFDLVGFVKLQTAVARNTFKNNFCFGKILGNKYSVPNIFLPRGENEIWFVCGVR